MIVKELCSVCKGELHDVNYSTELTNHPNQDEHGYIVGHECEDGHFTPREE